MLRPTQRSAIIAVACFFTALPATAHAGLLIRVGDASLAPGSTGTVDVTIESDSLSGDPLANYGFEFRIGTAGLTRLEFVDPQSDSQLTSPNYVFFGDSAATGVVAIGTVGTVVVPNDNYVGGDGTLSGNNVNVPIAGRLLAQLDITALTLSPPSLGDTFTIDVILGPNTFLQDQGFNDVEFLTVSGLVTIVPEPTTAALGWCGLAILGIARRRVQRSQFHVPRLSV